MKKLLSKVLMLVMFGVLSVGAMASSKVLVTSFGQSADAAMLNVLFKKSGLEYKYDSLAKPESIEGFDAIAVASGASSKGMGAAGINPIDELKRAEKMVKLASEKNIPVITFHLGGEGRRGKLSDQYVKVAAENSTKMIVVKGGNTDKFFTEISKKNKSELIEVDSIVGALKPIKTIF